MPFGLDTKSVAVGVVLGWLVLPIVAGKLRAATAK